MEKSSIQKWLYVCLLFPLFIYSTADFSHPFNYNLHPFSLPGKNQRVLICFHGMGGDYRIAHAVKPFLSQDYTVASFNFPDYGLRQGASNFHHTTFGTMEEILPALFVLKEWIVNKGAEEIDLYGYSAGGGAIINLLATLNSTERDQELLKIGITQEDKNRLIQVLQQGWIILDTPLKSISEIIEVFGATPALKVVKARYRENGMEPIEALEKLQGLTLNVIVHFQVPDEILSNRDDLLFIDRLKHYNQGITYSCIGTDKGHLIPHPTLWKHVSEVVAVKRKRDSVE